jgi:hypothetical protein
MDRNSNQNVNAYSRRSWQDGHDNMQKRHRSIEYATQPDHAHYVQQDLPTAAAAVQLCHTFDKPMALPSSVVNAYFADKSSTQPGGPEFVRHGWELFRNIRFYEAITTYTLDQLIVGHSYMQNSNLVPLYRQIHEDHLPTCTRKHDSQRIWIGTNRFHRWPCRFGILFAKGLDPSRHDQRILS